MDNAIGTETANNLPASDLIGPHMSQLRRWKDNVSYTAALLLASLPQAYPFLIFR